MEQTLQHIDIIFSGIALIFLIIMFIWPWELKNRISYSVIHLEFATLIFGLLIPKLIIKVVLNQSYWSIILELCFWAIVIAMDTIIIIGKGTERVVYLEINAKTKKDISESIEENNKKES